MSLASSSAKLEEFYPDTDPIATFWRQGTEGTYYWRLLIPARHLPARVNSLTYEDSRKDVFARQDGVAIWQFLGDLERTKSAATIQSAGVKTLMEVDDNYLLPPPVVPGFKSGWVSGVRKSFETGASGYSHQAHRLLLPSIDGLIVSTDELANQYEGLVPAGITVCPNSVDPDDWEPVGRVDRRVVVGYAGSDSHFYDLALVERALDYASRNGASLMKIGAHQNVWRWPHEQMVWTDNLADFRRNLQSIDIGLCPLKSSRWHDSKSDIKAMEYIMAGALPIVQGDSPVYRDWVDLVPSASTPKEWERAVREVLSWDESERLAMWQTAYDWLLENKTIHQHLHKWESCL
jgi:hypothetical protein